ncbi:hypothetical protein GCM10027275_35800 [Rhabdobacter roseus]|uniref:Uncharacterized protein n=1 Tax=Rhabdobacter roseus TaxID=1655419 RepID=A0A840TWQ2_9BACT|nr:hypothetical protein [Rhabdobacter roseus]MBB5286017.1 hypothetical protein [Rhabdobacter roseus]
MKKILRKYQEPFSAEINQSRNRVIELIAIEKGKKRDFFDFLRSSPVNFNEVTVSDKKIIIEVKPMMLNPFRRMGEIRMSLHNGVRPSEMIIEGEIIPYNTLYFLVSCMVIGFMLIWSLLVFAMTAGGATFIMLAISWTVFPLVLYLLPFWYRNRLREYKNLFLATLMADTKKKSIR